MNVIGRRLILWCLLLIVASAAGLNARDIKVSFPSRNTTIGGALAEIERQTGYLVSYKNTNFDTSAKVQLTGKEITLTDAMDQVLAGTGRSYLFTHNSILIVPAPRRAIPSFIDKPTSEEVEEIITEPDRFFAWEPEPALLESTGGPLPFEYPELDRSSYYSQGRVSRGRGGRPDYADGMPVYALKVNLLYGGLALAPNVGAEFGIAPNMTIDIGGGLNRWNLKGTDSDNKKLTHWVISSEYRYWLCERFNGHFLGAHALFGYYNIAEHNMPLLFGKNSDQHRFKGNAIGAGISYGYHLMVGERWNLEMTAGVGAARLHYDKWACSRCGDVLEKGKNRTYFGPTRAGITLVYMIK